MHIFQAGLRALAPWFLLLALVACKPGVGIVTDRDLAAIGAPPPHAKVVFIAGPDSHGPGAHEHRAGSELLATALREKHPGFSTANVYGGWPENPSPLKDVDVIVLYCDGGRNHVIEQQLPLFNALLDRGVGVVALHYAVEVPRGTPAAQSMLRAIGGYFETDWSVNPHWDAVFESLPAHPVAEGVQPFDMLDEWYFNMRFAPAMQGVTPILSAVPPLSTIERRNGPHSGNEAVRKMVANEQPQVVAWAFERPQGGRGFGFTGGHFHDNWQNENFRNVVLNAITWVAESGNSGAL